MAQERSLGNLAGVVLLADGVILGYLFLGDSIVCVLGFVMF